VEKTDWWLNGEVGYSQDIRKACTHRLLSGG
jgi:hypothetical protein